MASSSSQGPLAKEERLPRRRVIKAQDDATDSDGSVKEAFDIFREFTGYAACQNCGACGKCDGVDQEGHTYAMHRFKLATFVCPSNRCGAIG